jgi:hypothetical protein
MSVLAWRKSAPAMSSFDPEDDDAEESPFFAGERICPPPAETRGNSAMRICVVILIAAGGWWLFRNPESWQRWLSTTIATSSALMEYKAPSPVAPAMAPPDHTSPAEPAPRTDTALTLSHTPSKIAAAVDTTPPPSKPVATVTTHPALKEFSVSPLQPPATDQTDPYRARAVAAGLHPDLSRVLLSRLSTTDYRNARTAIDAAMAKTPDTGTFVWPRQRRPELALFQVRFVPGAAPGCRRYVVTVTKDRWSTTAPPMERCGSGWGGHHK